MDTLHVDASAMTAIHARIMACITAWPGAQDIINEFLDSAEGDGACEVTIKDGRAVALPSLALSGFIGLLEQHITEAAQGGH